MNASKTKFVSFNVSQPLRIQTRDGTDIDEVDDFKYLGSWMASTEKDIKTRKYDFLVSRCTGIIPVHRIRYWDVHPKIPA